MGASATRQLDVLPAHTGVELASLLRDKIVTRTARYGVIGLGYVGLPLAVAFAEAGFDVVGFDIDADRVTGVNSGHSHIPDVDAGSLRKLVDHERLRATGDMHLLTDVDVVSICVPTPLSKTHDPDISYVTAATEALARVLRRGQLIILESTTYPGTTRDVILPCLEQTGFVAGRDFCLAFSPERVDPGNQCYGIANTPKVVGGIDERSTELAVLFYQQAIRDVVPVSSPEAAEMVKLLENTFRAVNIALVNEVALMCDRLDINVWEVIEAAATKPFGFMPFFPGPGIGGHCVPLDPMYLSWKMRTLDYRARFIELAYEVNSEMPRHVVSRVVQGLNEFEKSAKGSRILILGVAYKADVADARESPALDIIKLLEQMGAAVEYADPHVPAVEIGGQSKEARTLTVDALATADCVVIVTRHRAFDYGLVARHSRLVVDTRNSLRGVAPDDVRATVLSI